MCGGHIIFNKTRVFCPTTVLRVIKQIPNKNHNYMIIKAICAEKQVLIRSY